MPAQGARPKRSPILLTRGARSQQLLRPRRRCPAVHMPVGEGARMTFQVIHSHDGGNARSRFRVIEQPAGREVEWVNRFLDRECVRRLAENTLRSYAMDLLHFLRWWASVNHTDVISQGALSTTVLLDYLRFQSGHHPQPAAATINRRVGVVERALRNEFPDTASPFAPGFHHFYWRGPPLGSRRSRPALSQLRVNEPKRIVMTLSIEDRKS